MLKYRYGDSLEFAHVCLFPSFLAQLLVETLSSISAPCGHPTIKALPAVWNGLA